MPSKQGTEFLPRIAAGTHDRDLEHGVISLGRMGIHDLNILENRTTGAK
jgi:hypothetical protein